MMEEIFFVKSADRFYIVNGEKDVSRICVYNYDNRRVEIKRRIGGDIENYVLFIGQSLILNNTLLKTYSINGYVAIGIESDQNQFIKREGSISGDELKKLNDLLKK